MVRFLCLREEGTNSLNERERVESEISLTFYRRGNESTNHSYYSIMLSVVLTRHVDPVNDLINLPRFLPAWLV